MKKRLLALTLGVMCAATFLFGCGDSSDKSSKDDKKQVEELTDAEQYAIDYKDAIDSTIDSYLDTYSETYSSIKFSVEGNEIVWTYKYKPGLVVNFDPNQLENMKGLINEAKAADEADTGFKFDKLTWLYLDSNGKELAKVSSTN